LKSSVSLLLGILVIGSHSLHGQPNLTTPAVCSGFTSNDMTLTYNGSTGSCSYYTFSFTYDPNITNLEWEIWSSGKNSYNSYMNYCDAVDGSPANYTFSFKGWYLIRLIITFSDNSTCQVYKYLNVNGSNMINCQPNPDETDVARPRVNINYSDPCFMGGQTRGAYISFAGDPLAPCTSDSKISYYLNYIDCDGTTHCDVALGYTLGFNSCYNVAINTVMIIEAVGNHCCYPDGFKRYKTIPFFPVNLTDKRPKVIIDNGNNCTDACTQWHSNCSAGNYFFVDSIAVNTGYGWPMVYPSSCSPYFQTEDSSLKSGNKGNQSAENLEYALINENTIILLNNTLYESVYLYDQIGKLISAKYNSSDNSITLDQKYIGLGFIVAKSGEKIIVKKIIL